MTKHTPGPWKVTIHRDECNIASYMINEDEMAGSESDDEAEANARLIATAPKMLEVLGQAISRLAELDKILNPYVGLNTPIDDSAGRVLRSAHDVFIKAGGVCTCGYCRAKAEGR